MAKTLPVCAKQNSCYIRMQIANHDFGLQLCHHVITSLSCSMYTQNIMTLHSVECHVRLYCLTTAPDAVRDILHAWCTEYTTHCNCKLCICEYVCVSASTCVCACVLCVRVCCVCVCMCAVCVCACVCVCPCVHVCCFCVCIYSMCVCAVCVHTRICIICVFGVCLLHAAQQPGHES